MGVSTTRIMLLNNTAELVSTFVASHFFDKKFTISTKNDGSAVTTVDLEAEILAKEAILGYFPRGRLSWRRAWRGAGDEWISLGGGPHRWHSVVCKRCPHLWNTDWA